MQLCRDLTPPNDARHPSVVALGNFDGVHRGHAAILQQLRALAAPKGWQTTVITFAPHPRDYFAQQGRGEPVQHIGSLRDRLALLAAAGVERVCMLRFNAALAQLSPEAFVRDILVRNCCAKAVVVGRDVRFGHQRAGNLALLQTLGLQYDFAVHVLEDMADAGSSFHRVSSSAVRRALHAGDVKTASSLLGREYSLAGRVVHGRKIGRTLGCPTLNVNLRLPLPALQGIWVVRIFDLMSAFDSAAHTPLYGVASLGLRPTVEQTTRYSLEVHVFDWAGHAYGQRVRIAFLHKLRDEAAYVDLPTLQVAIAQDMRDARAWLG